MREDKQAGKWIKRLFFVFSLTMLWSNQAFARTAEVSSWDDLAKQIAEQTEQESVEYRIGNNLLVNKTIKISAGKKVTIINDTKNLIKRGQTFAGTFFVVDGEKTELRLKGKSSDSRLYCDGGDLAVAGRFVNVQNSGTFYLDRYTTVQKFHSTENAGAIYNAANTVIYNSSKIYKCTSDGVGNAIVNSGNLKICGCDISGAENDNPDLYQAGDLSFQTDSNNLVNYVAVKIAKGITLTAAEKTKVLSNFRLLDGKIPVVIDFTPAALNVPLITVDSKVNGKGGSSLRTYFKAGKGFEETELLENANAFYKTYPLTEATIESQDETIIVGMGEEETVTLVGTYVNANTIIGSTSWSCSEKGYLNINKISDTSCEVYGKKHTGYSKSLKLYYTVSNANHTVKGSINVIVERQPEITMNQMKVGEESKLYAPLYKAQDKDQYAEVNYQWQQSTDGGKNWANIKGETSSCYTTEELVVASEKWRYRCLVTIKISDESNTKKTLVSQEISLASLNKQVPNLKLSDKKAVYTGGRITIDTAVISPRTLLGYVKYRYYTNMMCTKATTSANGAATVGGPPSNVGTYYVVAEIAETERYRAAKFEFAILNITKAKGEIAVSDELVKMTAGTPVTIAPSKNLGNSSFTVEVSNAKVLKAEVKGRKLVCTPLRPGDCTITINTTGNKNVASATTSFKVEIRPAKVELTKVYSKTKKKLSAKFKLLDYATGYEIQLSKKSNFKKVARKGNFRKKKVGKGIITAKKLTSKQKYYVRVRAYTMVNGKKCVGPWSVKMRGKVK